MDDHTEDTEDSNLAAVMSIADEIERLGKLINRMGWVITIDTVPQVPLAMGNYKQIIELRRRRGTY